MTEKSLKSLNPENGLISRTLRRELTMDNDNGQETFGMRLTRLERRLKEIDEHEKNLDTK
jgi:hypothetical protein